MSNPIFKENFDVINYTHIRQPVKSNIWRIFTITTKLKNITIKKALTDAIVLWLKHNEDMMCNKCNTEIKSDSYVIYVNNGVNLYYHLECHDE